MLDIFEFLPDPTAREREMCAYILHMSREIVRDNKGSGRVRSEEVGAGGSNSFGIIYTIVIREFVQGGMI